MKSKKILSFSIAVIFAVVSGNYNSLNTSLAFDSNSIRAKFSDELAEKMETISDDEFIQVGITLKDLDAFEIDKMIEQRSDFQVCDYVDINTYTERVVPKIIREAEQKYGIEVAHVMPINDPENNTTTYTADIYYDSSTEYGKILSDMKYAERVEYILSKVSNQEKEKIAKENFGMSKITQGISEDIDSYIKIRRECVTEAYKEYNYELLKEYISDDQIVSNVGFAPYMILNIDKKTINKISKDKNIETLSFLPEVEAENEMYDALNKVNISNSGYSYTGNGIVVGIIEAANGKYDSDYTMLNGCQNLNYVYNGTDTGNPSDHATLVTSIIKGKPTSYNGHTYVGVASGATVYQACTSNGAAGLYSDIENLATYGISILNLSLGYNYVQPYYTMNYQYTDIDRLVDYAINNYCLTVVVSAGNTGSNISSPGKAYDAITVGNCDTTGNAPYSINNTSSYSETDGLTNKPDIIAPGTGVYLPDLGSSNGTSISAPIVSGVAAQMIECMPTLKMPTASQNEYGGKTYYNTVKALLLLGANRQCVSTVNNPSKMVGSNTDLFRDKSGAGLLDAKKTIDIILGNGYFRSIKNIDMRYNGTSPNGMNGMNSFEENEKLRAVLCFSKINNDTTINNNNLDLTLRDSRNTRLVHSSDTYNNVEIIEYQFIADGLYQISAEVNGSINVNYNETLPGALVYYTIIPD